MDILSGHFSDGDKDKTTGGKSIGFSAILIFFLLAGCRVEHYASDGHETIYASQLISDQNADGDISFRPPAAYHVSSASITGSILVGIDTFYLDEYRGFINFDLRDYNGVPRPAFIESAILEIFINGVSESHPGSGVPLIIDLVSYPSTYLRAEDFHRSNLWPLMSLIVDIYPMDTGTLVAIDVTPLVVEAQIRGLDKLQLRLLLDDFAESGLVEIDDTTVDTAPLLLVHYY